MLRERIRRAAVLLEVPLVGVLLGVLARPEEEHMLAEVSQAGELLWVTCRTDGHVGARSGVVALRVGDEHQLRHKQAGARIRRATGRAVGQHMRA